MGLRSWWRKSAFIFTAIFLLLFTSSNEVQGSGGFTSIANKNGNIQIGKKINFPAKWEQYSDFEELQKAKHNDVFVPNVLPKGYILNKTEYYNKIIRATYLNENKTIIFTQSPTLTDFTTEENNDKDTVISWSTSQNSFELKGIHAEKSDLAKFKDSLQLISNKEDSITVPFEIISCSDHSKMYNSKNAKKTRSFEIYTPATFKNNEKKCMDYQDAASQNSIIIGLFSGEKGSGGHSINTSQVILKNNQLSVVFYEIKPLPNSSYTTVLTYPFQYIEVQIPPEQKISSVQFITDKGQAVANIVYF
ncbi:hypothetical protein D3C74_296400 [compost metagenome]